MLVGCSQVYALSYQLVMGIPRKIRRRRSLLLRHRSCR